MDPNKTPSECCQNMNEDSKLAYDDYQGFIEKYFEINFMQYACSVPFEQGLLVNLQGHTDPNALFKLSYLLGDQELIATSFYNSSVRLMASLSEFKFDDLIRGTYTSLGGIMSNFYNLEAAPSPARPFLNSPFSYILFAHGSADCPQHRVNAIQIELPQLARLDYNYETTGRMLANAIYDFYLANKLQTLLGPNSKKCI